MKVRAPRPSLWLPLATLLIVAGCRDAAMPLDDAGLVGPVFSTTSGTTHILQQARNAPLLNRYTLSFWAYQDRASAIGVDYTNGDPFLRFGVPKNSLAAGANGAPLSGKDSVYITVTIDRYSLLATFQPSGVQFAVNNPALIAFSYSHANQDLNGNGVVDGNDLNLLQQLAIWCQTRTSDWQKLFSKNDTMQERIGSQVLHFSQFAVSW